MITPAHQYHIDSSEDKEAALMRVIANLTEVNMMLSKALELSLDDTSILDSARELRAKATRLAISLPYDAAVI